jgi:hypothetical protein
MFIQQKKQTMFDHIATLEKIEKECIEYDAFLNLTCSELPEEAFQRGNDLNPIIARTGKLLADIKYHQDKARIDAVIKATNSGLSRQMSVSTFNDYVKSFTVNENFLFTWVERIHRTAEKQLEWTRTVISYAKEEMRLSGNTRM